MKRGCPPKGYGRVCVVGIQPKAPIRYLIEGREAAFTADLNFPDHALIWKEAIEFVMAGNQAKTMEQFWQMVREEYFISGGAYKQFEEVGVEW